MSSEKHPLPYRSIVQSGLEEKALVVFPDIETVNGQDNRLYPLGNNSVHSDSVPKVTQGTF